MREPHIGGDADEEAGLVGEVSDGGQSDEDGDLLLVLLAQRLQRNELLSRALFG